MPMFRKKPQTIEANQYLHVGPLPTGVHIADDGQPYVITIHEQRVYLEPGDWIIAEPNSETRYYPVKDCVFRQAYEPVS